MKTKLLFSILFAVSVIGFTVAASHSSKEKNKKDFLKSQIARGKYLVDFGDCNACHTPWKMTPQGPQPDLSRLLSGHPEDTELPAPPKLDGSPWFAATAGMTAWTGPWGISYAANLTPDQNTGLGIWTEEMFIQTMRTGKHMGHGRDILPPMPWQASRHLTDDDLKAVFAYLRNIPAIANRVPEPLAPDGKPMFGE